MRPARRSKIPAQSKSVGKRFSLRFLLIFIAVTAAGLGLWKAWSYRHPAHANISYDHADFTSGRSITVGPNVVSIRSIARNRYDGSIDVLKGPRLSTSIPNADVLKNCSKWLDVIQIELEPGPGRLSIEDVRLFDHETRHGFDSLRGLGWRVVEPNIIHVFGLGAVVPDQFDLWIRARSYPSDEVVVLQPRVGSQAELAGGSISIAEVQESFEGWNSESGFLKPSLGQYHGSAIRLAWNGEWGRDDWYDLHVVTCDGETRYAVDSFSPCFPWESFHPSQLSVPWQSVDHFEIRRNVKSRAFFFDGLKTLPSQPRKFDQPPMPTRTTAQLTVGTTLDEFAPLQVSARIYSGTEVWPDYHALLNTADADIKEALGPGDSFTLLVRENFGFYLPIEFLWKDADGKSVSRDSLTEGRSNIDVSNNGMCRSQIYHESVDELGSVEFVAGRP